MANNCQQIPYKIRNKNNDYRIYVANNKNNSHLNIFQLTQTLFVARHVAKGTQNPTRHSPKTKENLGTTRLNQN